MNFKTDSDAAKFFETCVELVGATPLLVNELISDLRDRGWHGLKQDAVAAELPEVSAVHLRPRERLDPRGARGWYCPADRSIVVVTDGRAPAQVFHTLVHEVAHALLHPEGDRHSTPIREVEAESVAFVVCTTLGLEVEAAAFNYVAVWGSRTAGDRDAARLVLQCGERIRKAAARILDAVLGETMAEGEEAA